MAVVPGNKAQGWSRVAVFYTPNPLFWKPFCNTAALLKLIVKYWEVSERKKTGGSPTKWTLAYFVPKELQHLPQDAPLPRR